MAKGADPVQLTQIAALEILSDRRVQSVDAYVEQLASLARVGRDDARPALARVVAALRHQQRQMSWQELQTAASEMTLKEAELEIKRRSYTIRRDS
jgi:hypothetical protein